MISFTPSSSDTSLLDTANRAIANEAHNRGTVCVCLGVTHILVPGLPDLGLTPAIQSMGSSIAIAILLDHSRFQ